MSFPPLALSGLPKSRKGTQGHAKAWRYARFIVESNYEQFSRVNKSKVDDAFSGGNSTGGLHTENLTRVLKYCLNTQTFDHRSGGSEDPDRDLYMELRQHNIKNTDFIPLCCDIFDSFHVNQ